MLKPFLSVIYITTLLFFFNTAIAEENPAKWRNYVRSSEYVVMPDGVKLAVDIYLPADYSGNGERAKKFPVVFRHTPYHRATIDRNSGQIGPLWGVSREALTRGYALVVADMRGTGASFGWNNYMDVPSQNDAANLVNWIAEQPWSMPKVCMTGGSYEGWTQLAAASRKPAALKCIVPHVAGLDGFLMRPGGVYSEAFVNYWSAGRYRLDRGLRNPMFGGFVSPLVAPVVDEDGDGNLADEIPLDKNGNGKIHDDYTWPIDTQNPPQYADGINRKHHYYFNAIMEHHAHPGGAPGTYDEYEVYSPLQYRTDKRRGDGLTTADLNYRLFPDIAESNVAILNVPAWFDPFLRSGVETFATLRTSTPSKLLVLPTYHAMPSPGFEKLFGISNAQISAKFSEETFRWYDYWLKGIDNGVMSADSAVTLYVMNGEGWREEKEWPLAREQRIKFFLKKNHRLGLIQDRNSGANTFTADFTHNSGWPKTFNTQDMAADVPRPPPVSKEYFMNRYIMLGVPEDLPDRSEKDKKVLTYTSEVLEADMEVTGHPLVRLWASSTASHGDFFFYLEDVDEQGRAILVTEYAHRGGFTKLQDNDRMIPDNPGIDVLPELPWHGYGKLDYTDKVFADGKVVEIVTDLFPTSWVFKKGHSIRLSIAAADWPTFELHPHLAPGNDPSNPNNIVPDITVHFSKEKASFIELPVISNRH